MQGARQSYNMVSLDVLPFSDWGLGFGERLVIAGPCSAETQEQVSETVQGLAGLPVDMIRAGIWKPRTRPDSFEGVGKPGLQWLTEAGTAAGKPVCVEVAQARHVEDALAAGIDVLWIGARTTVNPFAVQEIADALRGTDIPVLVKNPVNPDLELWLGAFERLNRSGIRKVAAVHRGFSSFEKSVFRNQPHWDIPIELRRHVPQLPILCDPSHICGRRDLLFMVAQKALDLNFDGLMIESHRNPDQAWSDSLQQLTPVALGEMLAQLVWRQAEAQDPVLRGKLEALREQIDLLDHKLIQVLAQRMELSHRIGEHKRDSNIAILQPARWNYILEDRHALALARGLGVDFVRELLQAIHKESIRRQAMVMNERPVSPENS